MEGIVLVILFLVGLIIGSFLNVLILRLNTGESIVFGRSRCFTCGRILEWYELIPVLSFIAQRGKCRKCGSKISWQYPLVEFTSGIVFLLVGIKVLPDIYSLVYWLTIWSILLAIAGYDLRHKIIPNPLVYMFIILAFFGMVIRWSEYIIAIDFLIAGLAAFSFFAALWYFSRGKWMGFGDAKLALGLGWILGPTEGPLGIMFAFWLGALVAIPLLILQKRGMKSELPFAPFLVLGPFVAWLVGDFIFRWYFSIL
jgi:leader peptidase (prepilin peptidase) / N-methyltransferase